jgi:indole-3-glycerol phosphate synthase
MPTFEHFPYAVPFAFENSLLKRDVTFICEVKKASPSKGIIARAFPYVQIAQDYEAAGASCLSVLTEPEYFFGNNEHLIQIKEKVNIPVLRKDFTIDEYQIYQSRALGADAVLLICSILEPAQVRKYIRIADTLGLSCLVEVHNEKEAETAVRAGARVIGVNNRDLKTFQVDLQNSVRLRKLIPEDIVFVSESGISSRADVEMLAKNGVDAVLIGESLMRSTDIKTTMDELMGRTKGSSA